MICITDCFVGRFAPRQGSTILARNATGRTWSAARWRPFHVKHRPPSACASARSRPRGRHARDRVGRAVQGRSFPRAQVTPPGRVDAADDEVRRSGATAAGELAAQPRERMCPRPPRRDDPRPAMLQRRQRRVRRASPTAVLAASDHGPVLGVREIAPPGQRAARRPAPSSAVRGRPARAGTGSPAADPASNAPGDAARPDDKLGRRKRAGGAPAPTNRRGVRPSIPRRHPLRHPPKRRVSEGLSGSPAIVAPAMAASTPTATAAGAPAADRHARRARRGQEPTKAPAGRPRSRSAPPPPRHARPVPPSRRAPRRRRRPSRRARSHSPRRRAAAAAPRAVRQPRRRAGRRSRSQPGRCRRKRDCAPRGPAHTPMPPPPRSPGRAVQR